MICVSIADITFERCIEVMRDCEMAEIRLDKLDFSEEQIKQLFSSGNKLIATFRKSDKSDDYRKKHLTTALTAGASYIDIDMEDTILVGLCVTSHDTSIIEAAGFTDVSIVEGPTAVHRFELYE